MRAAQVQWRGGGGRDPGLGGVTGGDLGRRPTISHNLWAPARMWREHAKVETELGLQERCVLVIHFPDPTQPNRAMDYPPGTMTEEELDHYRWKGKVRPAGPGLGS